MAHSPLQVYQLGSGSSGNATVVASDSGAILVDAGFSAKQLIGRMRHVGFEPDRLRAIVISHAHTDHVTGAAVLARKLQLPIWATAPTLERLPKLRGEEQLCELASNNSQQIDEFMVDALSVSHDAPGTVILRINQRVAAATDFGVATTKVRDFLSGLEGLLLEFNHDLAMLLDGSYPEWLKERVSSDEGHLSNAEAAELLCAHGFRLPRRALWLCHLSQENNTPELAHEAAEFVQEQGEFEILITRQHRPLPPVRLS